MTLTERGRVNEEEDTSCKYDSLQMTPQSGHPEQSPHPQRSGREVHRSEGEEPEPEPAEELAVQPPSWNHRVSLAATASPPASQADCPLLPPGLSFRIQGSRGDAKVLPGLPGVGDGERCGASS